MNPNQVPSEPVKSSPPQNRPATPPRPQKPDDDLPALIPVDDNMQPTPTMQPTVMFLPVNYMAKFFYSLFPTSWVIDNPTPSLHHATWENADGCSPLNEVD